MLNLRNSKRRIAVTGIGIISPCGKGWKPYWEAALRGQSCISYFSRFSLNGFPSKLAGEIPDFNPSDYVKQRKALKVMSREIQLAVGASILAVEDACLDFTDLDRNRMGVSLGTGIINNDLDEIGIGLKKGWNGNGNFSLDQFGRDGVRSLFPLWFLKYLPNMPACHISITHGLKGPSNTVTTSAAAGAQAIGEACRVTERGDADLMLAGGTDSKINPMGISRFHVLGLLSQRNHVAEKAYCPFDENHDGIILGEGSGLLVLEEMEHAKKRRAKIYGELIGYGCSSDFNHDPRNTEDFNGKLVAMTRALQDSSVEAKDIHFVLAHGSGIPHEDVQESLAIQHVFEKSIDGLFVTGVKPITGHLVHGSGGVEIAAAMMALNENVIPPLANLDRPAKDCELPFVTDRPKEMKLKHVLFNSFSFGGQNASLVIKKV